MEKSPEAFRTISEVADWLGVPTHVLRFWESRFAQIKPVKRAGGRRYYRPSDMALIGGIKRLLHDDGMTIRGAQKLLREKGVKHVAALSKPLDGVAAENEWSDENVIEATAVEVSDQGPETAAPSADTAPPEPSAEAVVQEPPAPSAEPASSPEPTPAEPQTRPEEPAEQETPLPVPEPAAEATGKPTPAIPETPDVPETDPEDDDTAYPGVPGIAARVRIADRGYLARNRGGLRLLKDKLPARASA